MHIGRCCHCGRTQPFVTLKAFDKTDGTLVWEYGIGTLWSHHHGSDLITGITRPASITLDKFVIPVEPGFVGTFPNRNTFTLEANCGETMSITQLNSLTGAEVHSTILSGIFTRTTNDGQLLLNGPTLWNACGLSGGNYCVSGDRPVQIELVDFASNNATKYYKFHGHTQQAGSLTLTTRTSGDAVAWAYNASNATIEAAIESSGDVVSATVTGGPWPYSPVSVEVVWDAASDDFATHTFTETSGPDGRSTNGAATVYDPSTGLIVNSIGYLFGARESASFVISQFGVIPSVPAGLDRCWEIEAGASNTVLAVGRTNGVKWVEGWTTGTTWTKNYTLIDNLTTSFVRPVPTSPSNNGAVILNAPRRTFTGPKTRCSAYIDISSGAVTEIDATNATLNQQPIETHNQDGSATPYVQSIFLVRYADTDWPSLNHLYHPGGLQADANGTKHIVGGRVMAMDTTQMYGLATTYSPPINYGFPARNPSTIGGTSAKGYFWKFYTQSFLYLDVGTEFRFRFASSNLGIRTTAWLAWRCTGAQIKDAIDAIFAENTEGVVSNVTVNPFGEPPALTGSSSLLERNLEIRFAGANVASYIPTQFVTAGRLTIELQNVAPVNDHAGLGAWNRSTGATVWSRGFSAPDADDWPSRLWLRGDYVYATSTQPVEPEL